MTEALTQPVTITGMSAMTLTVNEMLYESSSTDVLSLLFNLTIDNPSEFSTTWPLVAYDEDVAIIYRDVVLGNLSMSGLAFGQGTSQAFGRGSLVRTPDNADAISLMLSEYILGVTVTMRALGTFKVSEGACFFLLFFCFGLSDAPRDRSISASGPPPTTRRTWTS